MRTRLFTKGFFIGAVGLGACASVDAPTPKQAPTAAIVFQADLKSCRRVNIDLFRQVDNQDYVLADRLSFVEGTFQSGDETTYKLDGSGKQVFVREMDPGKYFIRSVSCNKQVPRQQFHHGEVNVVAGRAAYIGRILVGKRSGRVLLQVENDAEAAYGHLQDTWPEAADTFGILLMTSTIPTPL
ncbi:MAG: hypothetical protein AAGK23_04805 [Pseudomonadota bacterium]